MSAPKQGLEKTQEPSVDTKVSLLSTFTLQGRRVTQLLLENVGSTLPNYFVLSSFPSDVTLLALQPSSLAAFVISILQQPTILNIEKGSARVVPQLILRLLSL